MPCPPPLYPAICKCPDDWELRSPLVLQILPKLLLGLQLVQQRFGIFQIGSVEAFGEPTVDFGEHRAGFVAVALLGQQTREAHD